MWERLFVAILLHSRPPFFQALNRCAQPASDRLFDLVLVGGTIHGIQRLSGCVQRDVTAGDSLGAVLGWHQLHQDAITARAGGFLGIVIHAGRRILENKLWPPGGPRRMPVCALLQEFELKLKDLQEISLVLLHFAPPTFPLKYGPSSKGS